MFFFFFLSYPVILTLENHCSVPQCNIMARMIIKHLDGKHIPDHLILHIQCFIDSFRIFI